MSRPVEGTTIATGISGTNNSIQVTGDINVTRQQTNQCNSYSITPREIWFEVRKPVESFTGRRKELQNLHKEVQRNLGKNEHKLTVISQVTSISGLGGIGKSEVARMYAREHGQEYDGNVIWINAETYGTITESFRRLAKDKLNISTKRIDGQVKDINSFVQEVYRYFSKGKSLFIFDNADKLRTEKNEDEGIDKFLPYFQSIDVNEPYIIITSRNQKWGKTINVISISTFTEEEAIEFIKKELGVSDESKREEILQLAKTLQCFPLALQQAVAYIKHINEKLKNVAEEKFEIIDYLKRYEEKVGKLLNYHFPEDSSNCYIKTTFITLEVTLEKMKQNKHGQQALQVLEIIAYFASDNIPTEIFLKLVKGDKEKMESVLQLSAQYSMVNVEKGVLNIHRLVQQLIRLRLKEQKKEEKILRKAFKLIKTPIEEGNTDISKYLPHAISAWNYASNIVEGNVKSLKYLPHIIWNYVWNYACNDNNRILKKKLIEFSNIITYKLNNYTRLQGSYTFAYGIYQDVYNIQKRTLGEEHPDSLMTRHNMALVLYNQGKYDEALGIYQEVLNIRERVLGEEHPDTLTTRHNIALVLFKQGKYDKALVIYQDVLNIQERVLGGEHPSILATRHHMALALGKQGKYDEALVIYQDVLNIQERVLGGEHPITLTTKHDMALALDNQGKYDEALGIYQNVLNIQERVLGGEHPSTLTTKHHMVLALDNQGKYDEALGIYQDVLNLQEHLLGGEHPITLTTRHNMALVLFKQGKYDKALEIFQDVLSIKVRVLGEEHPDTLTTRNNIASLLFKQGKYDEALGIYQDVLNIQERVLGEEHPDTSIIRNNIAFVLDKQGKYD